MLCNSPSHSTSSFLEKLLCLVLLPRLILPLGKKRSHLLHPSKVRFVLSASCFEDLLLCNASIFISQSVLRRCMLLPFSTPTGGTHSLFCSTYESYAHPNFKICLFLIPTSHVVFPLFLTLSWCLFFHDMLFPWFSWCCLHLCSSSWQGVKLTAPSDIGLEWHKIQQKNNE